MNSLNRLYMVAIGGATVLIGLFIGLHVRTHGWESLVQKPDGSGGVLYAIGFWTLSGIMAGVILGKMDAVVAIGNAERWVNSSALDRLIVEVSCLKVRSGTVVQLQIANLISGPLGVGIVYLCGLALSLATGIAVFADYPGSLMMVIVFCTVWKLFEMWTRNFLVRRHFAKG